VNGVHSIKFSGKTTELMDNGQLILDIKDVGYLEEGIVFGRPDLNFEVRSVFL
jgi:hypothetical protein